MSIVREFKKVVGKQITIHLPDSFSAQEVEVIVIPYNHGLSTDDPPAWQKYFLAVSQWDINEETVRMKSWNIEEF